MGASQVSTHVAPWLPLAAHHSSLQLLHDTQLLSAGIHCMEAAAEDLEDGVWAAAKALLLAAPTNGVLALLRMASSQGNDALLSLPPQRCQDSQSSR